MKNNKVAPLGDVISSSGPASRTQEHLTAAIDAATEDLRVVIDEMASVLHQAWLGGIRAKYVKEGQPADTPRMRPVPSGEQVNINVHWSTLHAAYKGDNLLAAKAAVRSYLRHPENLNVAAYEVHEEWMSRTKKESYNDHLFVKYDALPEDEKEKDRVHVLLAKDLLYSQAYTKIQAANPCTSKERQKGDLALALYRAASECL